MITRVLRKVGYSTVGFFCIALVVPGIVSAADQVGRVVVLLDATSTMSAPCGTMSRFDVARWCLSDVLDLTPSGTPFSFVVAGNGGHIIETFDAMSPDVRCEVRRKVMRINPAGTTSLAGCFADPRMIIETRPDQTSLVVLITDGQACQAGSTAAAVTRWQKECGRPVQSIVVGPCTEATVVRSLSQFAASCGATFTQCPTARRLHAPLIEAFQICHVDCGPTHNEINDTVSANQLKLTELHKRLARIDRDATARAKLLSQLNSYVGMTGDENSPLTRAIFGKFAPHVEGNKDSIEAGHVSLQQVKEGIRKTARFIGYEANGESLRSANDKIQADTTRINVTTDRLQIQIDEVQKSLEAIPQVIINGSIEKINETLSFTKWGAALFAILFGGGGTFGILRILGVVQQQDVASATNAAGTAAAATQSISETEARMNERIAGVLESLSAAETRINERAAGIETQTTENIRQTARVLESLSVLDNQLGERIRQSVTEVVADHATKLRNASLQDRESVACAIEKSESTVRSALQTSFDTQRERLGTAIQDCAKSLKADLDRLDQAVDTTGTRTSDLLGKVARRIDKCAASIVSAETSARDKMDGIKEQIVGEANRNNERNAGTMQQLDTLKQSLSGLDTALCGETGQIHRQSERVKQVLREELQTVAEAHGRQTASTKSELQAIKTDIADWRQETNRLLSAATEECTAFEQRRHADAERMEQLCEQLRTQLTGIGETLEQSQEATGRESELTGELSILRTELTAKLKRIERMLRRIRRASSAHESRSADAHPPSDAVRGDSDDPVAELLRLDSLSREHANQLFEQGVRTLSQLANLDDASILRIAREISGLGRVGLRRLRAEARKMLGRDEE